MAAGKRTEESRKDCRRPLVDVFETDENVVLQFELPGIEAGDVDVGVEGDSLTVRTKARIEPGESGEALLREFAPANFTREFILSRELDRDNIAASWSNGVLTLEVPKAAAKAHKIEVETVEGD